MLKLAKQLTKMAIGAIALASCVAAANAGQGCTAEPLVKGIAATFEQAARNQSPKAFSSALGHYTDMRSLALFALGPYRSQLAASDEARYISLARGFLGRWMAENSGRISGSGLTIQSCSPQVVTAHYGNGTSVQFRLANARRVNDISVSGISLAGVLRGKFTEVVRSNNGDLQALMAYLAR